MIDWGSVPDWSTAIIATIALVVAGVAAKATIQTNRAQQETLKLQQRQFQNLEDQGVQAQASKVNYWWTNSVVIEVMNSSDSPIYMVNYVNLRTKVSHAKKRVVPPTGTDTHDIRVYPLTDEAESARLVLYFTDSSGRRWIRDYAGELRLATFEDLHADMEATSKLDDEGRIPVPEMMRLAHSLRYAKRRPVDPFARLEPVVAEFSPEAIEQVIIAAEPKSRWHRMRVWFHLLRHRKSATTRVERTIDSGQ